MENHIKGQMALQLGEKSFTLTPTFASLVKTEKALGTRLVPLVSRFYRKDFGVEDLAVIVACGINSTREKLEDQVTVDQIGQLIMEAGALDVVLAKVGEYIAAAVVSGPKSGN